MAKKKKNIISIKTQVYVAAAVVALLFLCGLFIAWLDAPFVKRYSTVPPIEVFHSVTLKGESTCLPHKGEGPHTEECALGIKTASGDIYALRGEVAHGDTKSIEVTGKLISPSQDEKYDIAGTLKVE